ncbi:MAG: ERCC4 domain-containing protein [Nanoarchaeota archaeon]|nr:ERCC4 domain-containing protein [Nanoarchaeota archaeon]
MPFLDIFSPSKMKKQKNKPIITIDYREKNSSVVAELLNRREIQLEFQQLPIADYLINGIAIERKTVSDFKSSIMNKRIFDQIKNLQQYPNHLLILEGILDEDLYNIGMHENAFRGFLLSLALHYKVHIIFTHNAQDTAKYLCVLTLKKERQEISLRPSKILLTKSEQQQFILEGFPGIGPVTAKKLLVHFKTLKNVFLASEDELKNIMGKKSEEFKKILD